MGRGRAPGDLPRRHQRDARTPCVPKGALVGGPPVPRLPATARPRLLPPGRHGRGRPGRRGDLRCDTGAADRGGDPRRGGDRRGVPLAAPRGRRPTSRSGLMRIGMISQWYEPETGAAAHPTAIARALAARGHEVKVLTGFPSYPMGKIYDGYRRRLRSEEV